MRAWEDLIMLMGWVLGTAAVVHILIMFVIGGCLIVALCIGVSAIINKKKRKKESVSDEGVGKTNL